MRRSIRVVDFDLINENYPEQYSGIVLRTGRRTFEEQLFSLILPEVVPSVLLVALASDSSMPDTGYSMGTSVLDHFPYSAVRKTPFHPERASDMEQSLQ